MWLMLAFFDSALPHADVRLHPAFGGVPSHDRSDESDKRATLFPGSETNERKVAPLWETVLMTVLLAVRMIPETLFPGSGGEFDAHFMWIFVAYLFDWPKIGLTYTVAYFVLHYIIHYLIKFFSFRRFQRPPPKLDPMGLLLMYVVGMVAGELSNRAVSRSKWFVIVTGTHDISSV